MQTMEEVFTNQSKDKVALQEFYIKAFRELQENYLKQLQKIKIIKETRQRSQSEVFEQGNKAAQRQKLFEQQKSEKSEESDLTNLLIFSTILTKNKNYKIKTQRGIYYQCKCHKKIFKTSKGLGGHLTKIKK